MNSSNKSIDRKDRKKYLWGLYRGFIKKAKPIGEDNFLLISHHIIS